MENTHKHPNQREFESLLESIQMASKTIASLVSRAGITNLTGMHGGGGFRNVQGEEQKKLDVIANEVLKNASNIFEHPGCSKKGLLMKGAGDRCTENAPGLT